MESDVKTLVAYVLMALAAFLAPSAVRLPLIGNRFPTFSVWQRCDLFPHSIQSRIYTARINSFLLVVLDLVLLCSLHYAFIFHVRYGRFRICPD